MTATWGTAGERDARMMELAGEVSRLRDTVMKLPVGWTDLASTIDRSPVWLEELLDDVEDVVEHVSLGVRAVVDRVLPAQLAQEEARLRRELEQLEQRRRALEAKAADRGPGERRRRGLRASRHSDSERRLREAHRAVDALREDRTVQ